MSDDALGWSGDEGMLEDDGVLDNADSLGGEITDDVLDTGIDAGDGYRAATAFGTTLTESRAGESLDQLLAEEEPDDPQQQPPTDEEYGSDVENLPSPRTGRLVAPDEGDGPDLDADAYARDVGIDGGAATAEEAAMHLTHDPDYH